MNFQDLKFVEDYQTYLDIAFSRAKKKADIYKQKVKSNSKISKIKQVELLKLGTIKDILIEQLLKVLKAYPSIDNLPIFYLELIKCTIDYPELKKSLGAINWAVNKISQFQKIYNAKIKKCEDLDKIHNYSKQFYGRISSILRQIKISLKFLEEARKIMKDYPAIKTSLATIAIVGFPNVGKTTLLHKLTGSKPEIATYAFTTQGINQGFIKKGIDKIQLLDTPGTLNRFDKMNNIEKISHLVIKHLAERLIYVFDPTEPYPLQDQLKLHEKLSKLKKPMLCYVSKTDIYTTKVDLGISVISLENLKSQILKYKYTKPADKAKIVENVKIVDDAKLDVKPVNI